MTPGSTVRGSDANGPHTAAPALPDSEADAVVEEPLVEEELLVEEVSIDGMCGVY